MMDFKALLIENDVKTIDRVSREVAREFRWIIGPVKTLLRKDVITKDEMIQILKVAPLHEKAIITIMTSSGLKIRIALNLRLENFKDDIWDESLSCYTIEITEELSKEGEPYITLCSWESASYIRDYLKMREARGEIIKPSSYVFTGHDNETPLSTSRLETFWHDLYREAGADLRPVKNQVEACEVD